MITNFKINNRYIGFGYVPYIIAEMSANHDGDINNAFEIIKMAKAAGADAIKMQTYSPDTITVNSSKPDFIINHGLWKGKSLYELYEWAHTPWDWHAELYKFAKEIGITIFSTPFDNSAVDLLESLETPAYKIASFECTDLSLIKYVAETKKPMIISTGMADIIEIQDALDTALTYGSGEVALLHCISGYPAAAEDYNLVTVRDMHKRYGVPVGISDHTLDNATAIAAVAMGACIIEKHVTLNRNGGGPDDCFSLEKDELTSLCNMTKVASQALGRVNYEHTPSEVGNVKFRRSLYFVKNLSAGQIICEDDIRSIRPGYGIPPKYLEKIIGTKVLCDIDKFSPVKFDFIDFVDN